MKAVQAELPCLGALKGALKRKNKLIFKGYLSVKKIFLEESLDKNIEICRDFIEFGAVVSPKTILDFMKCITEVDSEK
jgi:hypothetical protein